MVRTVFFVALFGSFVFAQDRAALTLNQIRDLVKSGISSSRIAQLVEQYGVNFELNDAASKRLREDGADEVVLAAVKKMAARYAEEQRKKRSETEEAKRREQEEVQRRKRQEEIRQNEESKRKTQEPVRGEKKEDTAQRVEEVRKRLQEEARRREEEKRAKEEPKREPPAVAKGTQEAPKKSEEPRVTLPFDQTSRPQEEAKQKSQKGPGPTLLTQEDAGRVASLRNVTSTPEGEVSGEIVNNSKQTVRDVQLQILYSWRWKNETRPGKDDPGTVNYHSLNQEIPPGKTTRFNYKPSPPLPSRTDGQFDITVKIIGFAEIFPGVRK